MQHRPARLLSSAAGGKRRDESNVIG